MAIEFYSNTHQKKDVHVAKIDQEILKEIHFSRVAAIVGFYRHAKCECLILMPQISVWLQI